jgi:hypothetical protein
MVEVAPGVAVIGAAPGLTRVGAMVERAPGGAPFGRDVGFHLERRYG